MDVDKIYLFRGIHGETLIGFFKKDNGKNNVTISNISEYVLRGGNKEFAYFTDDALEK